MSPTTRRRLRTARRVALRVLLGIVAVLVLLVGGVLAALHTPWGREQVRGQVVSLLEDSFAGDVRIGRITGSILGEIVAHDVVIEDREGRPAIRAARVRVDLALLPLLGQEARFYEIVAEGLVVEGRPLPDGTLNLAALTEEKQEEESGWSLVFDEIRVPDARVSIVTADGPPVHLEALDATAALALPAQGTTRVEAEVGAWWLEQAQPVYARTRLAAGAEVTAIDELVASLGALRVSADGVRIAGDEIEGEASIVAPAASVRALVPDSPLVADVALDVRAAPAAPGAPTAIVLEGTVGPASVAADLTVDVDARHVAGTIRATDVDAARILEGATETALDASVRLDVTQDPDREGAEALAGRIGLDLRGRVEGARIDDLDVEATLDHGRVGVTSRLRGRGELDVRADARVVLGDVIVVEDAHVVAHAADLAKATGGLAPVHGRLAADLRGRGRLGEEPSFAIEGTVRGRRLAYEGNRIAALELDVDATGVPSRPRGSFALGAEDITSDGRYLGNLVVEARSREDGAIAVSAQSVPPRKPWLVDVEALVHVERGGEVVVVELDEHRIRTAGVAWYGDGGTIRYDGEKVQVARLRTTIADGRLAVDGTYELAGRDAGDLAASIHVDGIDLAEVDRSLDLAEDWRGHVDTNVHVIKRGTRWYGSIVGEASGVRRAAGVPALDARGEVRLSPGKVVVDATVGGDEIGEISADLEIAAPPRIDDPAAWQRLDRDAITRGRVALDALDLAAIARAAGATDAEIAGRVDGELVLTATESHGAITARGVTTPSLPAPVDARFQLDQVEDEVVTASLVATLRDVATARAEATVAVPRRPFDVEAWARLDEDAIRGASLRVDDLVLDAEASRRLGLAEPLYGRAALLVEIAAGLEGVDATAVVRALRGGPIAAPIDLRLRAVTEDDGVTATLVAGTTNAPGIVVGEVQVPLDLAELRARGADTLTALPLDGAIRIEPTSLATVAAIFGRDRRLVGTLDGRIAIGGTVGTPTAELNADLRDAGIGSPTLEELHVHGTWNGRIASLEVRGRQQDGGALVVDARADLETPEATSVRLRATRFDLAPIAQLGPTAYLGVRGRLDANVTVAGLDPETAAIGGVVRLRDGRLPLSPELGTLRDAELRASLDEGQLQVTAAGRVGAGKLDLRAEGRLDGLMPTVVQIAASAQNITLIDDRQPRIEGNLNARVRRAGEQWRVDATISGARLTLPEETGEPLHPAGAPDDMVIIENGRPPPRTIDPETDFAALLGNRPTAPWLVAEIELKPSRVFSEQLRGKVVGNAKVAIGDDGASIDGSLRVTQGSVMLFDRNYRIDRALVRFDGGIDPLLDIALVKDFPQLTMFVELRGRASAPDLQLTSRPATYTEGQLLTFLLGGSPGAEPGAEVRDAATGVASSLISQKVGGLFDDYLPVDVDVLRFEAATANESASITVGKWFTRRLFAAYQQRLDARPDQNAGEAQLEYWLAPDVLIDARVGDRGHHDADLLWIKRW